MIRNIFSNIIKMVVSFNLIVLPAFGNATGPETSERTLDKIDVFLKQSTPSDIPFIDYMDKFYKDNSQPLKRFDLSSFEGKKIFVGYGVYDAGQNYCKYVEKPGTKDYKLYFDAVTPFNKHVYAISKGTMSYESCVDLANDFGGVPVVITSPSENSFVQNLNGADKWIGTERSSCNNPYMDKDNNKQDYFNWSNTAEAQCIEGKLNVFQNKNGNWKKTEKSKLNYCVVEVDSEDFRRPLKICAPWWKIERDYANPVITTFSGVDIYKINQADIPEQFNVCVKYNANAMAEAAAKPDREVTCTSYYDTQVAPECIRNPKQAICFVDECNGYIKNACKKVEDYTGFKPYTKAESIINNNRAIIKGKVDIKTHIYDCPPSPPSSKSCEEQATVLIYPKECPNNSDCEGRKQCIQKAITPEEKSKCSVDFKCEKIYGNPDSTVFDTTGTLTHLKNFCSDGTELTFEIDTQNKTSKKCLEYEYYDLSEQVTQNCVLKRSFSDYTVDTSLTEEDIYMNDPKCVRLNNVLEARPTVEVKVSYENMGYAKTVIKKSYLDESQANVVNDGSDKLMTDSATLTDTFNVPESIIPKTNTTAGSISCSQYSEEWYKRNDILNQKITYTKTASNGNVTNETRITSGLYRDTGGLYFPYTNVVTETDCVSIKNKIASINPAYVSSYTFDSLSNYCKIYTPALSADIFESIKGNGTLTSYTEEDGSTYFEYPNYSYITKNAVNKASCNEVAYCLNGTFNESTYASVGLNQCQVTEGEGFDYVEATTINELEITPSTEFDSSCRPLSKSGTYLSQFDGTQDIFSVQEVVTGNFGYFSNYNSHPFKNNVVKINDKEVYPIKKMSVIDDNLIYTGEFDQTSITTKKPNIVAGLITGGVVSVALSSMTNITIGPVIFIIVAMIFGKILKLNEQDFSWILYKLVPVERYKENIYGYDHRTLKLNAQNTMDITNGKVTLIYGKLSGFTGTLKPGDFKNMLKKLITVKEGTLTCLGFDISQIQTLHDPLELGIEVDYPKCKKLSWSCDKRNSDDSELVKNPLIKKMANNYIGAVNGVSIVVPYLGEYEVKAYDQFDNLLGSTLVKENEFIDMTNAMAKYAQINFGLSMELADGINEGRTEYACRNDLMVEWGGGVSGIYFENNFTGANSNCQKSQDSYVRTSSATKLTIKSTGIDRPHIIKLEKPLPFANRVFLVTLNKKEKRQYRCYKDFGTCEPDAFK